MMRFDPSCACANGTDFRFLQSACCDGSCDCDLCFPLHRIVAVSFPVSLPIRFSICRSSLRCIARPTGQAPSVESIVAVDGKTEIGYRFVSLTVRAPLLSLNVIYSFLAL
jgi:hypothetical protein